MSFSTAMPDELAIAHEGRLVLLYDFASVDQLYDEIEAVLRQKGSDAAQAPKLHQLARITGLDPVTYACNHSLLPATRVACRVGDDQPHGVETSRQSKARIRRTAQTTRAHCCPECAAEDPHKFSFSWFRRTHHVIGFDWCPTHGTVLHEVDSDRAFSRLPHQWIADGLTHAVPAVASTMPTVEDVIGRYLSIYLALLHRNRLAARIGCAHYKAMSPWPLTRCNSTRAAMEMKFTA